MMKKLWAQMDWRITPIVAYGLVFIGVTIGGLLFEQLVQLNKSTHQRLIDEKTQLGALLKIQEDDAWEERLALSVKRKQSAQESLWSGSTPGVIAANFQQSLRKIATDQDAENINVRVDPEVTSINGINVLAFDFTLWVPPGDSVFEVLMALAKQPHHVAVSDISFSHSLRDRAETRLTMSGFIPVTLAE